LQLAVFRPRPCGAFLFSARNQPGVCSDASGIPALTPDCLCGTRLAARLLPHPPLFILLLPRFSRPFPSTRENSWEEKFFVFYNILILFILCLKNNFSAKKIPFCPFSSAKSVLSTIPLRDRSNGLRRS